MNSISKVILENKKSYTCYILGLFFLSLASLLSLPKLNRLIVISVGVFFQLTSAFLTAKKLSEAEEKLNQTYEDLDRAKKSIGMSAIPLENAFSTLEKIIVPHKEISGRRNTDSIKKAKHDMRQLYRNLIKEEYR